MNRLAAILGLAWAGTVAGHLAGYALSYPAATERAARLGATGHGSFDTLTVLAAGAGAAGVAIAALRTRGPLIRVGGLAARLLPLQLAMFSFVELAERGFDAGTAVGDPAVLLGLLLQVATAVGLAILARGAQRTARTILGRGLPLRPRAPRFLPCPSPGTEIPSRTIFLGHARRRAPPLPLAS